MCGDDTPVRQRVEAVCGEVIVIGEHQVQTLKRLIIVADDFAGAADCAVAFAEHGFSTRAVLEGDRVQPNGWSVVALDTDTRDAPAQVAQARVGQAIAGTCADDAIFKKIDSTLRGNLAAELRAVLDHRAPDCVIVAPAFPATGRTTRGGRQLVDGRALEETEFAAQASSSSLLDLLGPAGRAVSQASLEEVRGGRIAELVRGAGPGGVLICDAETDADLDAIARGGVDSDAEIVWMGSAGLARRLADLLALPPGSGTTSWAAVDRPLLLVIGSPAQATQAQLRRLRDTPAVVQVALGEPGAGRTDASLRKATEGVLGALRSGRDCALTLDLEADRRERGRDGTRRLASVAAAAIEFAGGLVLTGGATARAVLEAIPGSGLTLQREIVPGIALGWTDPPASLPVTLKAGGFGDEDALMVCRRVLRDDAPQDRA